MITAALDRLYYQWDAPHPSDSISRSIRRKWGRRCHFAVVLVTVHAKTLVQWLPDVFESEVPDVIVLGPKRMATLTVVDALQRIV